MIEAGSETTAQILNNTIVGLLSNPEAIRKCQEELDRVIGSDRTPSVDDVKDLPYVRSLVKVRAPLAFKLDGRGSVIGDSDPIRTFVSAVDSAVLTVRF